MIIDGRAIAQTIFDDLSAKTEKLKQKGITPKAAIILIGQDPASLAYVKQKELKAESIGAKTTVLNYESGITNQELLQTIQTLNNDPNIHGIIVQRPLPSEINNTDINLCVDPKKDIDAFHPDTLFTMPLAAAVIKILEEIFARSDLVQGLTFINWLREKNIVVIGKGETGGGPVITELKKLGLDPFVIDSKTEYPEKLTESADIIISTVGNNHAKLPQKLKKDVIMIIVGMYKGTDGKLHGDYEKDVLENTASFYTPVPGGVGPVNVAMLLENLVDSAMLASNS